MAAKPSPNSLIHCAVCGEDYSATYKRCPFCGAKNAPSGSRRRKPEPVYEPEQDYDQDSEQEPAPGRRPDADPDDTYVFDGQDLFDEEPEDEYRPLYPKGGKRLAAKPSSNPFANADINWPRMITFLCSLVIIIAALVIVFTVIYPKLHGNDSPVAGSQESPSPAVTQPVEGPTLPGDSVTDPDSAGTDPGTAVTAPGALVTPQPNTPATQPPLTGPGDEELLSLSFAAAGDADFTLKEGESHTITLKFNPAAWAGPIAWHSSDTQCATVDDSGKVTNVNDSDRLKSAVITVTAGGFTLESKVFCRGKSADAAPSTAPQQTNPPAASQAPSGGGNVAVGKQGIIVGADGGLRVRSGPGTSYPVIESLVNGNSITVVAAAEGGWYQISFTGVNGATVTGYVLGEYISTN